MTDYFAFLRGINVGGKNTIKMDVLKQLFTDCGFSNVSSYIQSGNLIFQYRKTETDKLSKLAAAKVKSQLGLDIPIMIRSREELNKIVEIDPFRKAGIRPNTKNYVVFLSEKPKIKVDLPLISEKDGLEVLSVINSDAFVLSFEVAGGYGFPNAFIEKKLKVTATSRYWHILLKMLELDPSNQKGIFQKNSKGL